MKLDVIMQYEIIYFFSEGDFQFHARKTILTCLMSERNAFLHLTINLLRLKYVLWHIAATAYFVSIFY